MSAQSGMELRLERAGGRVVAFLGGEAGIYGVVELKRELLQAIREVEEVMVDLSGVAEFDGAALQVLLLARREAAALGHELKLGAPSKVVAEAFELCGLADVLDEAPGSGARGAQ